ncbi:putative disease resistance RPP13-like protein 1 [Chenopodium quinoa]|uniref:putative disease resistance RPP13-like protein 1 n=1 Tax=Chenopodium quinoa TaxID=63459 RepID=UPI000B788648|nr:putative disease resistance RPP13-like protein 1 [Chenopodium quinoa]
MAEGFLHEDAEESMEDKGHSYFLDLVQRSLMEPIPYFNGEWFIMHDLIHDLAQWAVGDVGSTMDIKNICSRTRYFSFTKEVIKDQPWTQEKIGQLRTFAYFGSQVPTIHLSDSSFQRFHYLRLLSMAHMGITELPNCIGDLKLLRFLDLSFNPELKELPESTSKLCNLQTLLLRGCKSLRKLVTNMAHLTDLRHLYIDEGSALMEIPLGIGRLTNLRTLKRFFLTPTSGFRISELKNLKSLSGSLDIFGLRNVVRSKDAEEAKLYEKSSLEVLRLFWGTSTCAVGQNIERDVLDQLQPQKSIKELQLKGYKGLAFPTWLRNPSFPQMVDIRLEDCNICDCLPPLGSLPSLKELLVKGMDGVKTVGPEFYGIGCSNPFPALKTLHFVHMESWEEWSHPSIDNSKAFPHLANLKILQCPLLQGIQGFWVPGINRLQVYNSGDKWYRFQDKRLSLILVDCPTLSHNAYGDLDKLTYVDLRGCKDLTMFLEHSCPSSIIELIIYDDNSSKQLSMLTNRITCLQVLHIERCSSLITIGCLPLTLVELVIKDVNIEQPAEEWGLHLLTSLRYLELVDMGSGIDSVESVPGSNFVLPSCLEVLIIRGFPNLKSLSCHNLPNLIKVDIEKCPLFSQGSIQFPDRSVYSSHDPHQHFYLEDELYTDRKWFFRSRVLGS